MEIKTKYNIGDKVWFTDKIGMNQAKIDSILIQSFGESLTSIHYRVKLDGEYIILFEAALFPTKEELLKSL